MTKLNLENFKKMFAQAAADITANEKDLCALDAVCGDGDHGTAIKGAICAANDSFQNASNLKDAFFEAGMAAMSNSNGSTSTLFGSLLMGISDGIDAADSELDGTMLHKAFESGLWGVRANTKADLGDKTLMDALIPAVNAMANKADAKEALEAAAKASDAGAKNTVNLQAKFGRAKNLGERSIGSLDAGAASNAMIFAAFLKTLN